jgi:putative endonuclease
MDYRKQNHIKGKAGEDRAIQYLLGKGYWILERNFRSPLGELDIVAFEPQERVLVCVEVKLWSHPYFPFDDIRFVVDGRKRKRLLGGFSDYIACHTQLRYDCTRVDVILLQGDETIHMEGVC